jgi:hypothetical protein
MNLGNRRPRVLVDFDGVWTSVGGQAAAVDAARVRRLAELTGWPAADVARCLDRVAAALAEEPQDHGWRIDGRITAYCDEDPFLRHNAMMAGIGALAGRGDEACLALGRALAAAGHDDLGALGSEIFMDASHAYLDLSGHDLLPAAPGVLRAVLDMADVVFCTNFTTGAVARSWTPRGYVFDGPGATPGLTLRGEARKQVLTHDPARAVDFGGRPVAVDRSHYREALLAERPDVVVGDVFSLDLALPLAMAEADPAWTPHCVLMRTAHTPAWSRDLAAAGAWPRLHALDDLEDLPALVAALTGADGSATP